jgi:hypothetical protein
VPPENLYYIACSFGNPEIVKVVSGQEGRGSVTPREKRACAPGRTLHVISERKEYSS